MRRTVKHNQQPMLWGLALTIALTALAGAGFATKDFGSRADVNASVGSDLDETKLERSAKVSMLKSIGLQPTPAAGQFDIVRSLVAGGGAKSAGGSFELQGSAGQAAAGAQMNGGQFSLMGGFWQPEIAATSTPTPGPTATPTPNPSPIPTATPTPTPSPTPDSSPTPNVVQFSVSNYLVQEDCTTVTINVNRIGDSSTAASVDYFTTDLTASERNDYITAGGSLRFAPGETSQSFVVLINEDSYVEGNETFSVNLTNPAGVSLGASVATVNIVDDAAEPATNALDDPRTFVCQQYHDFLNRQPDQAGWDFWTNQITACGSNQSCSETRSINVSAAFFLSIEFQNTGYLVERVYRTAFGDGHDSSRFGGLHQLPVPIARLREFLSDTQKIGDGVVVLQSGWEQKLEGNKQTYVREFVQRAAFRSAFPTSMTAAQFIDQLNQNAESVLSPEERQTLINLFGGADTGDVAARAQAVRQVSEDQDLYLRESNRAFVLMQYFGYLRRNPNDPQDTDYTGYDFWLTKLDQFDGNYVNAEMVKAFITSIEYRRRFGP